MPAYFAGYEIVAQTKNFLVTCEDDAGARVRAQNIGYTGYGWDLRQSPGEGLSNLLGALLHPAGYYDTGQGPRINQWLNGGGGPPMNPPRADFVSKAVDTDRDIFSYGCAILFINYLVDQPCIRSKM